MKHNMEVKKERLAPIMGSEPTRASVARYKERVMRSFMQPDRKLGETDQEYSLRYADAMQKAQKAVRPPMLPIIGHGQQLAAHRLASLTSGNIEQGPPSRQVLRHMKRKGINA